MRFGRLHTVLYPGRARPLSLSVVRAWTNLAYVRTCVVVLLELSRVASGVAVGISWPTMTFQIKYGTTGSTHTMPYPMTFATSPLYQRPAFRAATPIRGSASQQQVSPPGASLLVRRGSESTSQRFLTSSASPDTSHTPMAYRSSSTQRRPGYGEGAGNARREAGLRHLVPPRQWNHHPKV